MRKSQRRNRGVQSKKAGERTGDLQRAFERAPPRLRRQRELGRVMYELWLVSEIMRYSVDVLERLLCADELQSSGAFPRPMFRRPRSPRPQLFAELKDEINIASDIPAADIETLIEEWSGEVRRLRRRVAAELQSHDERARAAVAKQMRELVPHDVLVAWGAPADKRELRRWLNQSKRAAGGVARIDARLVRDENGRRAPTDRK